MRSTHLCLKLHLVERGRESLHARHRRVAKSNTGLVPAHQQPVDSEGPTHEPQRRGRKERLGRGRKRSEPVADLGTKLLDGFRCVQGTEPAVHVQLGVLGGDEIVGQIRRDVERHVGRDELGLPAAIHDAPNRFLEHPEVHVEPDRVHEPGLFRAKQIPRPSQLQILESDSVARPQLGVMLENLKPPFGIRVDRVRNDEITVGAAMGSADTPPELIELRQPEVVGAVHEHRVRVGHVQPRLDDHRGHEHVDVAGDESVHHVFQITITHLAVTDGDSCSRNHAANPVGDRLNGLDAVVDKEYLTAAIELPGDALLDQSLVPRLHEGQHGRSITRCSLHQRHVPQPGEGQVQRARYRRRGERQHVGLQPELLQPLLVLHAESVLLVDDDEAEVREANIGTQQPVGADDDVDFFRGQLREDIHLFLR